MRFRLRSVRMVKIKTLMTAYAGEDGGRGTLFHCWWECKLVQLLWKSVWWFLRKFGINLPQDPTIPLFEKLPKGRTLIKQEYFLSLVHSSIIHNNQNLETT